MESMAEKLCKLLKAQGGVTVQATTGGFPHLDGLDSIFRDLGGIHLDGWPTSWKIDMKLEDGTFLELDEYLHFNRYRQHTLKSPLYKTLPGFPLRSYKDYCTRYEPQCYKAGRSPKGKWCPGGKSKCHRQFDRHPAPPEIGTNLPEDWQPHTHGPCRWKQRALYDFAKDVLIPYRSGRPLVRLAIWDEIGFRTLGYLLGEADATELHEAESGIRELITLRMGFK